MVGTELTWEQRWALEVTQDFKDGPRIRHDSEAGQQLTECQQDYMMAEQYNTYGQPTKEAWLTTWYGPVGTPDRDALDAEEAAKLATRLAKPGNVDERPLLAAMRDIQERRREAVVLEQAIMEVAIAKVVKYPVGTVIDVVPQPKKKSLYYRTATRFLILKYKYQTVGRNEFELSDIWLSAQGVYLDEKGEKLQPTSDPNTGRPLTENEYLIERISLNSNLSEAILGISENQQHACYDLPEIKRLLVSELS
jgi:hypothetical protein